MKNLEIIENADYFVGLVHNIEEHFKQYIKDLTTYDISIEEKLANTKLAYELLESLENDKNDGKIEDEDFIKVNYHPMGAYVYVKLIEEEV